jgi:hypothetical protein
MVALKCPSCNAPLQAPDDVPRFTCQFCGMSVVPAEARRAADAVAGDSPVTESAAKPAVPIPEKLQIDEFGDELTLSWRWFSPAVFFLLPFAIAWNAFLVGWYAMAGSMPDVMPAPMRIIFLVFPIAHVAVGLGLIYAVVTMLLNRTTLRIRHGQLQVTHGPIYYPGGRTLAVDDIDQLYCGTAAGQSADGKAGIKFALHARLKSGRTVVLFPALGDVGLARAVEQLVERRLGIADQSVAGETLT